MIAFGWVPGVEAAGAQPERESSFPEVALLQQRLATPKAVKAILAEHGLRVKKSLGQNFLIDPRFIDRIVAAAAVAPGDKVLEIGPGIGGLTESLLAAGGLVVAVEVDRELVAVLAQTLAPWGDQVQIVHADALKTDLAALLQGSTNRKAVANLPYYITTPLILRLLERELGLSVIVVMVQREVADRMLAAPGGKDFGAFSVAVQYRAEVELVMHVPRTVFFPAPQVDSAVLRLTPRPFPVTPRDEAVFVRVVRAAFNQRRKTIRKALQAIFPPSAVDAALAQADIDGALRAEALSIAAFVRLSDQLTPP